MWEYFYVSTFAFPQLLYLHGLGSSRGAVPIPCSFCSRTLHARPGLVRLLKLQHRCGQRGIPRAADTTLALEPVLRAECGARPAAARCRRLFWREAAQVGAVCHYHPAIPPQPHLQQNQNINHQPAERQAGVVSD